MDNHFYISLYEVPLSCLNKHDTLPEDYAQILEIKPEPRSNYNYFFGFEKKISR